MTKLPVSRSTLPAPVSVELHRFVRTQTRRTMRDAGYSEDAISRHLEALIPLLAEMGAEAVAEQMLIELPLSRFHPV